MLNAKHHSREAEIISKAGELGRTTIATNMAGRGTDIQLGKGVPEKGGLFILSTVRQEARRIDNQLRGRAGRQGDPGESRFFLSLEDDLLRIFGGERIARLMTSLKINEDEPIEHALINRAIENAQSRVEAHNFSIRKHLLEYDDVMNRQREVIYQYRSSLLNDQVQETFTTIIEDVGKDLFNQSFQGVAVDQWDLNAFRLHFSQRFNADFVDQNLSELSDDQLKQAISKQVNDLLAKKRQYFGENAPFIERHIALSVLDNAWKNHLVAIDRLKEGVGLRGYAQKNPLDEYKREAYGLFEELMALIHQNCAQIYFRTVLKDGQSVPQTEQKVEESKLKFTHAEASLKPQTKVQPKRLPHSRANPKIGRNSPCFCGSGKKYKNCHGRIQSAENIAQA